MKQKTVLNGLLIIIAAVGCSSDKRAKDELPYVDVRKDYLEKEISLTDFADVSYVHLKSDNDNYLYRATLFNFTITQNSIVVYDISSGSILFFSRDGVPKSRFKRLGQGPEEYIKATRILYDEESDDVFVCDEDADHIQVYSSAGQYKRKIRFPQKISVNSLASFDSQSLFGDSQRFPNWPERLREKSKEEIHYYTTYYRINKTTGVVLDSFNLPSADNLALVFELGKGAYGMTNYHRLVTDTEGFLLCNPETDTVYLYKKNKSLTPIFRKMPSVRDQDPMVIIENLVKTGKYHFFSTWTVIDKRDPKYSSKYYVHDRETGEILIQKITLPDYKEKVFRIGAFSIAKQNYCDGNGYIYELDLIELKEAYREGRLGGKLKELVATLDEMKDNNVLMLVHFK